MKTLILITTLIFAALLIYTAPLGAAPNSTSKPRQTEGQLPFGIPVPGKPGLVYSPYAKGKIMSVQGYRHGEVVLCPYTNKKFRVP
jgi:hypothetical protein